jgi:hypothetical protein
MYPYHDCWDAYPCDVKQASAIVPRRRRLLLPPRSPCVPHTALQPRLRRRALKELSTKLVSHSSCCRTIQVQPSTKKLKHTSMQDTGTSDCVKKKNLVLVASSLPRCSSHCPPASVTSSCTEGAVYQAGIPF